MKRQDLGLSKEEQTTDELIDNIKTEQDILVHLLPKSLDEQVEDISEKIKNDFLHDTETVMELYTLYKNLCDSIPHIIDRIKVMNSHINLLFLKTRESDFKTKEIEKLKQEIKALEFKLKETKIEDVDEQELTDNAG